MKWISLAAGAALSLASVAATAATYDTGASDTEIKIGNTMPYSGGASSSSVLGRTETAYFAKLNREGGINGRQINFISLDDAYSPPRTVEQTRRLVEQEGVLFIAASMGTPTNAAIRPYLHSRKVPQLLISAGGTIWNDPENYPWATSFFTAYDVEGRAHAQYLLQNKPDARIAVIRQNDDFGHEFMKGFREGLGDQAATMIVAEETYEFTDPSIDAQLIRLEASGADVLFNVSQAKFTAQVLRRLADSSWEPLHLMISSGQFVLGTLDPATKATAEGVISTSFYKDVNDPRWADDPAVIEFFEFAEESRANGYEFDATHPLAPLGYMTAQAIAYVLEQAGDDLTRANVAREATNIDGLELGLLLPGVTVKTTPDNYAVFRTLRMQRYDGQNWEPFGEAVGDTQ